MVEGARRVPRWVYVVAVIVGSFLGTLIDGIWIGGGYTFTKIVAVAAPMLIWVLFGRTKSD